MTKLSGILMLTFLLFACKKDEMTESVNEFLLKQKQYSIMKNKYLFILILISLTSCIKKYFIPENVKEALPVDYYYLNDTITLSYSVNHNVDTLMLLIEENIIETSLPERYAIGAKYKYENEFYSFEATSPDEKQTIQFNYDSYENKFKGIVKIDEITFTFESIEKDEYIKIDNIQYKDVLVATSNIYDNTCCYISNTNGIIKIVADSITLSPID